MLYTINNIYPDMNFAFTLTAGTLGLAPLAHTHGIGDISQLADELNGKADGGHQHEAVPAVIVDRDRLTGNITLTGAGSVAANKSGSIITIASAPAQSGNVAAFRNANPARRHTMLKLFFGDCRSIDSDSENLIFTEDSNAPAS
jgi:hypothetical protein